MYVAHSHFLGSYRITNTYASSSSSLTLNVGASAKCPRTTSPSTRHRTRTWRPMASNTHSARTARGQNPHPFTTTRTLRPSTSRRRLRPKQTPINRSLCPPWKWASTGVPHQRRWARSRAALLVDLRHSSHRVKRHHSNCHLDRHKLRLWAC